MISKNVYDKDALNISVDDTTLILKSDNLDEMYQSTNFETSQLQKYNANGMQLNETKTEYNT